MINSLTLAANFVDDAFLRTLATPFKPEDTRLGEYTFLPWVRTGLCAGLTPPVGGELRATVISHLLTGRRPAAAMHAGHTQTPFAREPLGSA